jgi:hypothetical protein
MNGLLNSWWARAGIVAGLTWLGWKYLPLGATGKTVVLAVGGVSAAMIVGSNVPLAAAVMSGRLPLPAGSTTANG